VPFNPARKVQTVQQLNLVGRHRYDHLRATPLQSGRFAVAFAAAPYLDKTFDASHTHHLVSGAAEIDSGDLEAAIAHVREHGYGVGPGSRPIAFMNPLEADEVSAFKAGEVNNNTVTAKHDFIPSQGAPAYLQPDNIVGEIAS
jgi:hypothetical protein